jgi:hypothetical protein
MHVQRVPRGFLGINCLSLHFVTAWQLRALSQIRVSSVTAMQGLSLCDCMAAQGVEPDSCEQRYGHAGSFTL